MLVIEELLTIIPMHDRTGCQDIFDIFKNYIARTKFPICKLVSITTDGAPAMIGNKSGQLNQQLKGKGKKLTNTMFYKCQNIQLTKIVTKYVTFKQL